MKLFEHIIHESEKWTDIPNSILHLAWNKRTNEEWLTTYSYYLLFNGKWIEIESEKDEDWFEDTDTGIPGPLEYLAALKTIECLCD